MSKLLWCTVVLLAADLLLMLAILIAFLTANLTFSSVTDLSPFFVFIGVLAALVTFLINLERGRSDEMLKTAIGMLEKAHEMLNPKRNEDLPPNNRHVWLVAARLISTAEKMAGQLTENSHRLIYRDTREYWRSRLHDIVFPSDEGLPSSFYAEDPSHMDGWSGSVVRQPLSEKSLAFIYRFIKWPDGLEDPIGDQLPFTREEVEYMCSFGPRGLGNFLSEVNTLRDKRNLSYRRE